MRFTHFSYSLRKLLLTAFVLQFLSGCASIGGGPSHSVLITSNPNEAEFTVLNKDGELVLKGRTPQAVRLRASGAMYEKARYLISFESPGLAPKSVRLKAHFTPLYFLNLVLSYPGLVGMAVIDPFTGSMYTLRDEVYVDLLGVSGSQSDALNLLQPGTSVPAQ